MKHEYVTEKTNEVLKAHAKIEKSNTSMGLSPPGFIDCKFYKIMKTFSFQFQLLKRYY